MKNFNFIERLLVDSHEEQRAWGYESAAFGLSDTTTRRQRLGNDTKTNHWVNHGKTLKKPLLNPYSTLTQPCVWKYVAMIFAVLVMSIANIGVAWGAASTSSDGKYATGTITFADFGSMSTTTCYWYNGIKVYSGGSQSPNANNSAWSESVSLPAYISNKTAGKEANKGKWGSSGSGKQYTMSGLAFNTHTIGIHVNGKCTVTVVVDKNIGSDTDDASISASVDATAYGTAWTSSNYATAGTALTVTSSRADKTNYPGRYTLTIPITTDGEKVVKMFCSSGGTGAGKLFCYESITVTPAAAASPWQVKGLDDGTWAGFNMTGSGTVSVSRSLSADTEYDFKLYNTSTSKWWGNGTTYKMTQAQTIVQADAGSNCKLRTSKAGSYTFSFDPSTNALTVTYPDDYKGYWYPNGASWSKVYAYCYDDDTWKNADWPGVEITSQTEDLCGTHYYINTSGYTTVIFNNGSSGEGNQTGNITISGGEGKHAVGAAATGWSAYPTYTISYAAGTGSGSMSSQTGIACGTDKATTANSFTAPSGYQFAGWIANVDVTVGGVSKTAGTVLADGVTIENINSNITLTAQWEAVKYTVTYNVNGGGSVTPTSATQASGGASVTLPTPTWSGYTFEGWYSAGTKIGGGGASYTPTANITLYAHWTDNISGKVFSFIDNNYGDKFKSFTGYGWVANDSTGRSKTFTNASTGVEYRVSAAGWDKKNNAISALAKFFGGTSSMSIVIPTGKIATVKVSYGAYNTSNRLTVGGKNQTALSTALTDGMTNVQVYNALKEVTLTSQTGTLTLGSSTGNIYIGRVSAVITGYTVSYAAGTYGSGSLASGTKTAGSSFTLSSSSSAFTRSGYVYDGWSINEDGSTKDYNLGGSYTTDAAITLYPHWVADCVAPTTVNVTATVNEVSGFQFYPDDDVVLTATPTGSPAGSPITYQWKKNGADIDGATSSTYTIDDAAASDAGKYTCTISYGACSTTSAEFELKCMQFYLKDSEGADISNHALTKVDATHATLILNLTGGTTYKFRVTDGCNNWYGNTGTMTSSDCTNWTMPHDADASMTTGLKTANYTFNFDFTAGLLGSEMKVSIVYPGGNQAAGKVIYWDNSVLNWDAGDQWYRIGKSDHHSKTQMTLVPGTANLYKVTTAEYTGFEYWHIANNEGEGTGNLFWTKDNDPATDEEITHAMAFEGAPVTADAITITPTTSHETGEAADNNNCEFYTYGTMNGMKTDRVTISDYSNGTITVNYVDTDEEAASFTSDYADLAHTVKLTSITAVANTGYDAGAITINGGAYTANYVVTGATTIAATFSPHVYTITLNQGDHGASNQSATVAYLATAVTSITQVTSTGYTLTGYYDGETKVLNADGSFAGSSISGYITDSKWTKTSDATLTAKWEAKTTSITFDKNGGSSNGSATATYDATKLSSITAATPVSGYDVEGYYTTDDDDPVVGVKIVDATGRLVKNTTYTTDETTPKWKSELENLTLYARYTAEPDGCFTANSTSLGDGSSDAELGDGTVVSMTSCTTSASGVSVGGNMLFTAPSGYAFETFSFVATCGSDDKTNYYKINGGSQQSLAKSTIIKQRYTIPIDEETDAATIQIIKNGTTPVITNICYTLKSLCSTPDAPDELTVSARTTTSATLSISDDADVNNYEVYYSTESDAPEASTVASETTTSKSVTISGLSVGTTYYAWVRSVCNEDYKSSWVAITGSTFTTLHQYTMSYNKGTGDGISGSQSNQTKTEGTSFTLPGVVFTRSGYVQIGWTTSDGGTQTHTLGGSYTTDAAQTFYPVWGAVYTVTFNSNGGGAVASKTQTTYGGSITMPSGPSSTDSTFLYWVIGGNTYAASTSYTPTSNITAYAAWKEKCSGGGGGSSTVWDFTTNPSISITNSSDNTIASHSGTSMNMHFYAASSGDGVAEKNDAYCFALGANAGQGSESSRAVYTNRYFYLDITSNGKLTCVQQAKNTAGPSYYIGTSTKPLRSEHTAATAKGKEGADAYTYEISITKYDADTAYRLWFVYPSKGYISTITWTPSSGGGTCYYVKYDGNGAESGSINDATAYTSSSNSVTVLGNTGGNAFVRDGYTFNGWNTKANGSGDPKTAGGTFTITKDTVLYAQWVSAATTYTVSITADPDGYGSVSSSSVTSVASGTTLSTSTNTLSVGATDVTATETSASAEYTYAFDEWTLSDGTALPSTVTEDLSVYANFTRTANNYTLTWSSNGGSDLSGSYTSGSTAYGASITAPNDPTLSNYTFDGWKTNNDGTGSGKASTMPAANTTYYAAWKQTVTLNTGSQGSGSNQTPIVYLNGTSVSDFTPHTASGYTLQGYYTAGSGGVKVLNADGTFAAANVTDYITSSKWSRTGAAPTLYAQWVATEDCSTSDFVIKKGDDKEYQGCMESSSYNGTATSFTAGSPTTVGKAKMTISNYSDGAIKRPGEGKTFSIVIEAVSGYELSSVCWAGKVENDETVSYYWDDASGSSTTITPTTTSGTGVTYNAPSSTTKFTAYYEDDGDKSGGIWWRNVQVEVCAAGGTTYNVTYDGNDETGGTAPTDASSPYDYGTTVTVLDNTGSLAKTNYTFAGWTTNNNGTGSSYEAGSTFSITDNTTLYAKWTQTVTFDANTENHGSTGGSATAVWNATGLTGITHATPASGYKLLGYYTDATSGTKVINSDGTFAETDVTDYITDGKWSRTSTTTLYAQYEVAGSLTWNLTVNSGSVALGTDSKTSSFTEISTSKMTNATAVGIGAGASADAKKNLTGKIETPSSYDGAKYVKVTFKVADGYEFTPSSITVKAQPVTTGKSVRLSLTDGTNTITMDADSAIAGGKTKDVILAGDGTSFKDSVTLLIYCFGATDKYRLGTPIKIEGSVEASCATMPDYESMSYTTTTFAPNADASGSQITIVGGTNVNTYRWKYNTVNDRTSGTVCGTNSASLTPLTDAGAAADGTRYYWCEMTNDACGITIKSPAVAITVSASKSTASVTWTAPASKPNYGGGGYTIRATVNEMDWDGTLAASMLTAPEGIRFHDVTCSTADSKQYIEAEFDVTTSFDTTANSKIPFVLSLPATTNYNALISTKNVDYEACSGTGDGASYALKVRKTTTKDGNYYYWKNDEGWISVNPNSSFSSEKASSNMYDNKFDSVYNTNGQYVYVRTYRANINKVRIYADFRANDMTVSGVYKSTTYFTPGSSNAVDYSVIYNEDEEAVNMGTQAQKVVDIILDEAMDVNDILAIKFSSAKVRPLGAVMTESSAGDLTTALAWSETVDDDSNKKEATTADASFTITASPTGSNSNTLGVITYASNHPEYASVNATTGQVTPKAAGTAQITATLAASGCYESATATYTVVVSVPECDEPAGRVTVADAKTEVCAGDPAVLTFTYAEGATIQWYNDETEISNGGDYTIVVAATSTTSTLTTAKAGVYWAKAWTSCTQATAKRSNSITLTSKATEVGATREVSVWYVKNGRKTPNIALWNLDEGTHLNTVTITRDDDGDATAIGLTSTDFTEKDGVVYLSGKEPSSNATGADVDYTLTLTVENACGTTTVMSASDKTIKLVHQKNTDKHVLAFVVVGTDKGGFTEGITAAQTTSMDLYNEIAKNFDVLATNIKSTDDEQKLKEYYSQFDIICITDYPNTAHKGVNGKSYVDAMGALVDIRPILTMEAWVSKLDNWKAKGIVGTPKNPTTRQYSMDLQCKDHEIFSGTELTKIGEGEDAMYRVKMVCDTLEDYKTLDATYGEGDHAEKSGYEYGSKPALQGFTYDASMSSLLPIGRIDDGSGNDLEVGVERQTKMEARLLVLGINSYAMERLGEDGQTIVINALKYLMKKDAEDIADCSNYFLGDAESGDKKDWFNAGNWSNGTLPEKTQEVRIVSECVINGGLARAGSVKIITDGKYNHGSSDANGKLTIKESGVLLVEGKIHMATAPYYNEVVPTTSNKLGVQTWYDSGSNEYKPGALIFDNSDHLNEAEVEMHTKSHWDWVDGQRKKYWSYVAVPTEDVQVPYNFWNGYTYIFDEQRGWIRRGDRSYIHPFEGVGFSAETGGYDFFNGRLASTESLDITLTKTEEVGNGDNLIGNSWTAPIQIANFESSDFVNANATIYIFNTGSQEDVEEAGTVIADADNDGVATAGQWLAIPIGVPNLDGYDGLKVIPSLQAYQVVATGAGSLHLDYDRLVRGKGKGGLSYANSQLNQPIRAPKRDATGKQAAESTLRVRVSGTKTRTDVWLLQDNRFSYDFDNGWEADYVECDDRSAQLYAVSDIGNMAFLAQPEIDGTLLGFQPAYGCTEYTFSFRYRGDEKLYLNDLLTETSTLITNESTYTFSSEQEAVGNRFLISSQPFGIHGGATGTEGPDVDNMSDKPMKFIYNDKMYILYRGQVYDANGKLVNRK